MILAAVVTLLATAPGPAPVADTAAPPTAEAQSDAGVAEEALPPPIPPRELDDADAGVADATAPDGGPASIPGLVLNATIEPALVPFGAPFELVVTITRDRGLQLALPGAIPDVDSAPRTGDPVRTVQDLPAAADAGPGGARVKETIKIPFLALDTKDVKTPAFTLTGKDGAAVDVPALDVRVDMPKDTMPNPAGPDAGPPPPGTVVLEPNAPAIAYAVPDARPFVVLGAFAGAGLLFFLVRLFARRRKATAPATPAVPPPPPRPAHEVALERLEALLASGLLQRGETAEFVERLMDEVLRDYISARFQMTAGTRTTRELVKDLLGVAVLGLDVSLVESLLADADLVKFAKASIPSERAHAMATRVRALIDATKLVPGDRAARAAGGGAS